MFKQMIWTLGITAALMSPVLVERSWGSQLSSAAQAVDAKSQFTLGWMYLEGKGLPQNYSKAFSLSLRSAEQNYAPAENQLAGMYQHGTGVKQSYPEALRWLTKAAEQGLAEAQSNLAVMYLEGMGTQEYCAGIALV